MPQLGREIQCEVCGRTGGTLIKTGTGYRHKVCVKDAPETLRQQIRRKLRGAKCTSNS